MQPSDPRVTRLCQDLEAAMRECSHITTAHYELAGRKVLAAALTPPVFDNDIARAREVVALWMPGGGRPNESFAKTQQTLVELIAEALSAQREPPTRVNPPRETVDAIYADFQRETEAAVHKFRSQMSQWAARNGTKL